jgi:hypothetical protein
VFSLIFHSLHTHMCTSLLTQLRNSSDGSLAAKQVMLLTEESRFKWRCRRFVTCGQQRDILITSRRTGKCRHHTVRTHIHTQVSIYLRNKKCGPNYCVLHYHLFHNIGSYCILEHTCLPLLRFLLGPNLN